MRRVTLSVLVVAASGALASSDAPKPAFTRTSIKAPFIEQFTDDWSERWTPSEATKTTPVGGETFKFVGKWEVEDAESPAIDGDKGLVAKSKAAHHAISAPFAKPVDFKNKPLVVQYEVKYQKGGNCGGGYLKLLEDGFQTSGKEFSDTTPWVVMFGPDLTCPGTKVHFIVRHKSPKTGEVEEKHLHPAPQPSIEKLTNLYTLVLHPNNTYNVLVNGESSKTGSLLEDFNPPFNPTKEIDDPDDSKPADWVDIDKIPDPEATKPEDWDEDAPYEVVDEEAEKPADWLDDEPATVPDPDATKPEEWDDEEDGEWIAPTIPNPKCSEGAGCGEWKRPYKLNPAYKGKWVAPLVDNPEYKGAWLPRKIANPGYFKDDTPVKSLSKIGGVGIELWTMTEDILFDNIYVGHSLEDAQKLAKETFEVKKPLEIAANKKDLPEDEAEETITFKEDPIEYIRSHVLDFVDAAKVDPVAAFKAQPEIGAGIAGALFTLFGMIGALLGLVGSQAKPVVQKVAKKVEEKTPVAPAGDAKKDEKLTQRKVAKS